MEFNVKKYWENRYDTGGGSGWGSHDESSVNFKKKYINNLINKYNVKTLCELGCGDGNQLKYFSGYDKYYGQDISCNIIDKCKKIYLNDNTKEFVYTIDELPLDKFDMILSLDVIYHLVEDNMFHYYMNKLFLLSNIVCIFSTNNNIPPTGHLKNRKIVQYINENFNEFELMDSKKFYKDSENNIGFFLYVKQ